MLDWFVSDRVAFTVLSHRVVFSVTLCYVCFVIKSFKFAALQSFAIKRMSRNSPDSEEELMSVSVSLGHATPSGLGVET